MLSISLKFEGSLVERRLIFLDAMEAKLFFTTLRKATPNLLGQCFSLGERGVHLAIPDEEYELGWLGYSGRNHELFPDRRELVAFVYDAYEHFLSVWDC